MLMRFDPFREVERMAFGQSMTGSSSSVMAMDAYRDGDRFVVHFDVPGVDAEAIDLSIEKNVLTVTAERRWEASADQEIVISERPQGTFSRQLFLGESLDADGVEAAYQDGVMTVTIPISEKAKPRRIEVASGGGRSRSIEATAREDTDS